MAHLLGIDVGPQSLRVALVRTAYRKVAIEALREVAVADHPTLAEALLAVAAPLKIRGESVAVGFPGDQVFTRRVDLPPTAARQVAEVLPFELEAQLPFELAEYVFDSRILPRSAPTDPVSVLAIVGRSEEVKARIDLIRDTLKMEPERVDPGAFPLSNLAALSADLAAPGPVAILHLDADVTDLLILANGQPELGRTISVGTSGLPASAPLLASSLRQTLFGWLAAGGKPVERIYLTGPGASLSGAVEYLSAELGTLVARLPPLRIEASEPGLLDQLDRYAKAVGLAVSLAGKARSANLRTGSLAYERGFGFLREKIPMLAGIAAVIIASFAFSTWMEYRALMQQNQVLQEALGEVTREVLGEEIRDPAAAQDRISVARASNEDPMPYMDGFDVMVQIAKAVPPDVTHDIEELDFQKERATVHGIVPTIPDAQHIAESLKTVPCFRNVKIVRTNQEVNANRQKYVLEFDVKCPTDEGDKAKKKEDGTAEASASAEDKP
jgi:general secretion pathway protein L